MIELILVRHGQTDNNIKGTYLGATDAPLNDEGINQCHITAKKLINLDIDKVYSSPLKRTLKTAKIINSYLNLDIQQDNRLKERNFGIFDNLTYKEICEKYPDERILWEEDWINYCIKNGESAFDVFNRNSDFIIDLLGKSNKGKILIVTHLGCIRNIIAYILNMKIGDSWRFRVDNASVSHIETFNNYAVLTKLNI